MTMPSPATRSLDTLLQTLGRHGYPGQMMRTLHPVTNLQHWQGTDPHKAMLLGEGIHLVVHCVNPDMPDAQHSWGLHSAALHTSDSLAEECWDGPWPGDLPAE